jgi:hypothetical protein
MLNGLQFAQLANEGRANIGGPALLLGFGARRDSRNGGRGTDWQDLIFQNSIQQSYNLGATGG